MNKQNVTIYNRMCVIQLLKEGKSDTCLNTDELWRHFLKEVSRERKNIIWFHLYEMLRTGTSREREIGGCPGDGERQQKWETSV